jgi:ubiquinone/menaquinone biosynthesis C-methylase UbiE
MHNTDIILAEVFKDTHFHQAVARIIARHLTNHVDVRNAALNGLDLGGARKVLDLGCGFGFFTEALQGRVHPQAMITGIDRQPGYKSMYMDTCRQAGLKGSFSGEGIQSIKNIESNSVDLVICSYALYFFPAFIPEIARIMKEDGVFVTITHAKPHMIEFTSYLKEILFKNDIVLNGVLPYEKLIDNFSSENGYNLLFSSFDKISEKKYISALEFKHEDFSDFVTYFNFKHSFFLPETHQEDEQLIRLILDAIRQDLKGEKVITITKDDVIYTCTCPGKKIKD